MIQNAPPQDLSNLTIPSLYAYLRANVTEEEKAATERWARDVIQNGGRPISELRDLIEELRNKP